MAEVGGRKSYNWPSRITSLTALNPPLIIGATAAATKQSRNSFLYLSKSPGRESVKEMRCGPKINISFRRRQSMIVFFRAGIVLFLPPLSDSRSFVRRPRRVLYAYLCLPMRHSRLRRLFNHPPNSPLFLLPLFPF